MTTIDVREISRHLFNESNDALLIISPDEQRVLEVNPTAQRMTGMRRKQLLALTLDELLFSQDAEATLQLRSVCRSTSFFHSNESYLMRRGDRKPLPVNITVSRIHTESSVLAFVVARDISERVRAERTIAEQQAELAHVSRVHTVGEMAASVTHEVTQPTSAIANYANAALANLKESQWSRDDLIEHLQAIEKETRRIAEIVHRIRRFIAKAAPHRSSCALDQIVNDAVGMLANDLQRRGVELKVNLPEPSPLVHADPIQIQQVLVNLIKNAYEAMVATDAAERRIEIASLADREWAVVEVRDHGCGVDPDQLPKIFDTFYSTKRNGMGMGLPICRTIIHAHGGELSPRLPADGGFTMQIKLPIGGGENGVRAE